VALPHDTTRGSDKDALTLDVCYNVPMRCSLANAVFLACLSVPLSLYAQPRGGGHSSFSRSGGGYHSHTVAPRPLAGRASSGTSHASSLRIPFAPLTGSSLINPGEASCLLNPSFAGSYYCRQYFPRGASLGFEPVYPGWFPTVGYETDQPAPSTAEPEQDSQLAAQVGNLAGEVEMMREDQAQRDLRGAPAAQSPREAEEKPPATLFVYRDGHQAEVQNYAILGNTLWVFADKATRRVPLADLDLAATQRANEARGVDFAAPNQQ